MDIASEIDPERLESLRQAANEASGTVWNPYSNFTVLAAVETVDGRYYGGANVENANFSLTKHAEEAAVLAAIHDGALARLGRQWLRAIYVTSPSAGAPCGGCRQFINEFIADGAVWVGETDSGELLSGPFAELLPYSFGPEDLGVDV